MPAQTIEKLKAEKQALLARIEDITAVLDELKGRLKADKRNADLQRDVAEHKRAVRLIQNDITEINQEIAKLSEADRKGFSTRLLESLRRRAVFAPSAQLADLLREVAAAVEEATAKAS